MNEERPVVESSASGAGVSQIQSGWRVLSSDGEELGTVARFDDDRIVVDRSGLMSPGELIIPRDVVSDEDEEAMQVTLSVDSSTADQFTDGNR